LLLLSCGVGFQFLNFSVLFEELIEQHRVHRVIAHSIRLALLVTGHKVGIYFFYVFSHEAKLRDSLGVKPEEVVSLFRTPPETNYFRDYDLVYWLGSERGYFSFDSEW
jgi:hypothetical protein